MGCSSLINITLPESLTTIGISAFFRCYSLTSITIPDKVTTIGGGAFAICSSLTSFSGKYASSDQRCLVMDGKLVAFAPSGLTAYTIPHGVTMIGVSAFEYCTNLTSITIPDGVTMIEDSSFFNCSKLTNITIPDGVTTIGYYAFYECRSLTNVYCKPTTPPTLGSNVYKYPVVAIHVPQASVEAYKSADGWSEYADKIVGYDF